jgi:glycerol uptake facilitator-like aquaporin
MVIFRKFPAHKALWFIVCQIFGGYVACMLVYYQWEPLVKEMVALGNPVAMFTAQGAPGAFALYRNPEVGLGHMFLNEFVGSFVVGITIWASMDPTNFVIPPSQAAFYVSAAYVAIIWAFAVPGVALNTARDVGGRLWALTIWGTEAAGGRYAAIAALTNLLATVFAVVLYELFLVDSDKPLTPEALMFGRVEHGNRRLHPQEIPEIEASGVDKRRDSSTEKTSTV